MLLTSIDSNQGTIPRSIELPPAHSTDSMNRPRLDTLGNECTLSLETENDSSSFCSSSNHVKGITANNIAQVNYRDDNPTNAGLLQSQLQTECLRTLNIASAIVQSESYNRPQEYVMDHVEALKMCFKLGISTIQEEMTSVHVRVRKVYDDVNELLKDVPRRRLPWSAINNLISQGCISIGVRYLKGQFTCTWLDSKLSPDAVITAFNTTLTFLEKWSPPVMVFESTRVSSSTLPSLEIDAAEDTEQLSQLWPVDYPCAPIQLEIPPNFPARVYRSRTDDIQGKWRHWGQRKLMMNEIEFLTIYSDPDDLVVYAGAAPSQHTPFLSEIMFPNLQFDLIDPAPFAIRPSSKINIINSLFTDEMAKSYNESNRSILFISDIRRTFASEELIMEDMNDQMRWHEIIKSKACHLKFRLPWNDEKTDYLDGIVYIQPYGQPQTTETRLVATSCDHKLWNNREYEQQCYYFNSIVRKVPHIHGVTGANLDANSYDAAAEVEILKLYLTRTFGERFTTLHRDAQNDEIAMLSVHITKSIGGFTSREWLQRCNPNLFSMKSRFLNYNAYFDKRERGKGWVGSRDMISVANDNERGNRKRKNSEELEPRKRNHTTHEASADRRTSYRSRSRSRSRDRNRSRNRKFSRNEKRFSSRERKR